MSNRGRENRYSWILQGFHKVVEGDNGSEHALSKCEVQSKGKMLSHLKETKKEVSTF